MFQLSSFYCRVSGLGFYDLGLLGRSCDSCDLQATLSASVGCKWGGDIVAPIRIRIKEPWSLG